MRGDLKHGHQSKNPKNNNIVYHYENDTDLVITFYCNLQDMDRQIKPTTKHKLHTVQASTWTNAIDTMVTMRQLRHEKCDIGMNYVMGLLKLNHGRIVSF